MTKRLDIHITALVPDDMFAQSLIIGAGKVAMDGLTEALQAGLINNGGDPESVRVTSKIINPTPGRTRRSKKTEEVSTARTTGRTARAAA